VASNQLLLAFPVEFLDPILGAQRSAAIAYAFREFEFKRPFSAQVFCPA